VSGEAARTYAHLAPMARDVLEHDCERKRTPHIDPPAAGRIGKIRTPTLVLIGDADVDAVIATAHFLATSIPGARKYVFANAAHMLNLEQPAEFNEVVRGFLADHPLG
jgi:pimeloyl-ACP methyl ester carboxylesterase